MTTHARLLLGPIAVIATVTTFAAGPATGVITNRGKSLKVVDAFTFDAVSPFGDPVLGIRLSDHVLDRKALDTVIDVPFELDAQRGTAAFVDLFLDKNGDYHGSTYDFGGTTSCAFCMEPAVSDGAKLRIEAGHVRGTVKVAAGSYDAGKGMGFDLTLDVPLNVLAGITPLANAAAGAEARALQACRALVAKNDETAMSTCFSPDNYALRTTKDPNAFWPTLVAHDSVFEMTGLQITAGRTRGEWVELSIAGTADGSQVRGVVYLRRMAAGIRYSHSVIE